MVLRVVLFSIVFIGVAHLDAHEWNGLAIDEEGNLYTIDAEDGQIWRVTPKGEVSVFLTGEKARPINHPHHLARDHKGAFWLASG